MLLPFIAWAITGVFFFIKPGYSQAYEKLAVKTYPGISSLHTIPDNQWTEIKLVRSILGEHLLVKNQKNDWLHIDKSTQQTIHKPSSAEIRRLVSDAISHNVKRYGEIESIHGLVVSTSTGIKVTLNWNNMSIHQKGSDTDFIQTMYKIHYLQWTGVKSIDNVLGIVGLALVILLALFGVTLSLKRSNYFK